MALRSAIRIGAAIFTLLGVVVGVVGTMQMTRMYHPYTLRQVSWSILGVIWTWVTSGPSKAEAFLKDSAALGEINPENRFRSLAGLYLLILSFVFQTLGASLSVVDALLTHEP
jgi:hypothetical protein